MTEQTDVVVIGAGIAGGALATVLARAGVPVVVLEQQVVYRDRVRGENMAPWGVAEAKSLGLFDVFLDGGAHVANRLALFGTLDPEEVEATAAPLADLVPGVPGMLNFGHPAATEALAGAATAAGATVRRGVRSVRITPGAQPEVSFSLDGAEQRIACRLIVGADGRSSTVRQQAGIELHRVDPLHFMTGLLVDEARAWPEDLNALGIEGDFSFAVFPQGDGRLRLYLNHSPENPQRFTGPGGARDLVQAFDGAKNLPRAARVSSARPAGPCAAYPGDDTWTDPPFVEGVTLIGDAAGYNDPVVGQGLSLAMADVRVVSELMLQNPDWSLGLFASYAEQRHERMRRARFTAQLFATMTSVFGAEAEQRRARAFQRLQEEPQLGAFQGSLIFGPDALPAAAFADEVRERLLAD